MQYRKDDYFLALQIQIFDHSSSSLWSSGGDLSVDGHLIKAMGGIEVVANWSLYFGLGRGQATVDMDNSTCLSYSGCLPSQYPAVRSSASLSATVLGVAWEYEEDVQAYLGFQTIRSGPLGFKDAFGTEYFYNRLKATNLVYWHSISILTCQAAEQKNYHRFLFDQRSMVYCISAPWCSPLSALTCHFSAS